MNFGRSGKNRSLAIAVLKPTEDSELGQLDYLPEVDGLAVTVRLVDGSKYSAPQAIRHAIEIKYIKNVDIAGSRLERENIEDWPYFTNDLQKLADLPDAESRHLVVVTNKNPFQQSEVDGRSTDTARQRYRRVEEECEERGIDLTMFHPD